MNTDVLVIIAKTLILEVPSPVMSNMLSVIRWLSTCKEFTNRRNSILKKISIHVPYENAFVWKIGNLRHCFDDEPVIQRDVFGTHFTWFHYGLCKQSTNSIGKLTISRGNLYYFTWRPWCYGCDGNRYKQITVIYDPITNVFYDDADLTDKDRSDAMQTIKLIQAHP